MWFRLHHEDADGLHAYSVTPSWLLYGCFGAWILVWSAGAVFSAVVGEGVPGAFAALLCAFAGLGGALGLWVSRTGEVAVLSSQGISVARRGVACGRYGLAELDEFCHVSFRPSGSESVPDQGGFVCAVLVDRETEPLRIGRGLSDHVLRDWAAQLNAILYAERLQGLP